MLRGMKARIGIKFDPDFKEFLQKLASKDNRSLSNFIKHAIKTYIKEHKGITWKKYKK